MASSLSSTVWNLHRGFVRPARCLRLLPFVSRTPVCRHFGTSKTTYAQTVEPLKPKPKDATQLRRTAAASLPIRSNPTPTRSDIQPVSALTTAERYILPQLRDRIPNDSRFLFESLWVPKWGRAGKEGEIFVFANGSFVCWGLEEIDARRFSKEVIERSSAAVSRLVEPESEDLDFVTDPNE